MTQLVELQNALPKFDAAGVRLYAISYDEPAALADFAKHHDITYPLLSDLGSKVIDQFGIRNHFVTEEQVPYYGIPFPGTYLVDEQGVVSATFFQRNIAQRDSAEAMIDSALGTILLGDDEPQAAGGADDIRLTATYHGGGGQMKSGALRQIVVRFDLAPGVHIYDDPVPTGMVATTISVSGPPGLHVGETQAPPSHAFTLPGLDAELQVWDGQVDFVVPVYVDDRIASLVEEIQDDDIEIEVKVAYQACSDESCRIPQRETLTLRVPLAPHVGNELAGNMAGTTATTMRSRKYLRRMMLRGLVRNPVRGLRYLLGLWRDLRRGPAGRKR
jgi:peroxiredoxin